MICPNASGMPSGGEALPYLGGLRSRRQIVSSGAVQSPRTASTVCVRHNKVTITDGPCAETEEQLGLFFLIRAGVLNEAIQIVSKWPSARLGTIEVHPIEEEFREESRYR